MIACKSVAPKCPKCSRLYQFSGATERGVSSIRQSSWELRVPLMLHCGHTFCADCLRLLTKTQSASLKCPSSHCQVCTPLEVAGSIKSLSVDIYSLGLLLFSKDPLFNVQTTDVKYIKASIPVVETKLRLPAEMCCECETSAASCSCEQCKVNMCEPCFKRIHKAAVTLRQHQARPIIEHSASASMISDTVFCVEHKKELEFYCETDKTAICSHCYIVGSHKNHAVSAIATSLHDDVASMTNKFNQLLSDAANALMRAKESYRDLNVKISKEGAVARETAQEIQDYFSQLHASLQTREETLSRQLKEMFNQQHTSMERSQGALREYIKNLEMAISSSGSFLMACSAEPDCSTRTYNSYVSARTAMQRLEAMLNDSCCTASNATTTNHQMKFEASYTPLAELIANHGRLVGDVSFVVAVGQPSSNTDVKQVVTNGPRKDENVATMATNGLELGDGPNIVAAGACSPHHLIDCRNGTDAENVSSTSTFDANEPTTATRAEQRVIEQRTLLPDSKISTNELPPTELCIVTHIRNPCSFFVQLCRDSETVGNLTRSINTYCNSLQSTGYEIPKSIIPDDFVLAKFSQDGLWYRARVLVVNETRPPTVDITYVDFGNPETVTFDKLRSMPARFQRYPQYSLCCSLVDIVPSGKGQRWSPRAVQDFARLTRTRPLYLSILRSSPTINMVDLIGSPIENVDGDGPASVRDCLVFLEHACFISPHSLAPTKGGLQHRQYLKAELPHPGSTCFSMISNVASPHDFHVQMIGDESRYLSELMVKLQKTYGDDKTDVYNIINPYKGQLCVAQFSEDLLWYRAQVVDFVNSGQIAVRYVDYGNSETVSIWSLKKLLNQFIILPMQAVHCSLADIATIGDTWDLQVSSFLSDLLLCPCHIKVKEILADNTLSVYLHTDDLGQSVNRMMVARGWAIACGPGESSYRPSTAGDTVKYRALSRNYSSSNDIGRIAPSIGHRSEREFVAITEKPQDASPAVKSPTSQYASSSYKSLYPQVSVSHIVSPGEFYLQQFADIPQFITLLRNMTTYFDDVMDETKTDWCVGDACAVRSNVDKKWYRAQIISIDDERIEVLLVDYGRSEVLSSSSQLRVLDPHYKSMPAGAIRCHLGGVAPAGDVRKWSCTACDWLRRTASTDRQFFAFSTGAIVNNSMPVDLLTEKYVRGNALSADQCYFESLVAELKEQGLALPLRPASSQKGGSGSTSIVLKQDTEPAGISESQFPPNILQRILYINSVNEPIPTSHNDVLRSYPTPSSSTAIVEIVKCRKPKKEVGDAIDYLPPDPLTVLVIDLSITHVDDNFMIYGHHRKQDLHVLNDLMSRVQTMYANSKPTLGIHWRLGQPVISQFTEDDQFYRASIVDVINESTVEVVYVDFGNHEILDVSRVRETTVDCLKTPIQAYKCQLNNICPITGKEQWSTEVINFVRSQILNGLFVAVIKMPSVSSEVLLVELKYPEEGQDFGEVLCRYGMAMRRVQSSCNSSKVEALEEQKELNAENTIIDGEQIENFGSHDIQVQSEFKDISSLSEQHHPSKSNTTTTTELNGSDGNTTSLPEHDSHLVGVRTPPGGDHLMIETPVSGLQVDLGAVFAPSNTLESLPEKPHPSYTTVLCGSMSPQNYACRTEAISSCTTVDNESCVDSEVAIKLKHVITDKAEDIDEKIIVDESACVAINSNIAPKDEQISNSDHTYFQVAEKLVIELSPCGIQESASGVLRVEDCPGNETTMNTESDLDMGDDLSAKYSKDMVVKRVVRSPYRKLPPPPLRDLICITVTEVDTPRLVYAQNILLEDSDNEEVLGSNALLQHLLTLNGEYSTYATDWPVLPLADIKPGQACVAQCSIDAMWYRAEILRVSTPDDDSSNSCLEVYIIFIDYGSTDIITKRECLRVIPVEHLELPMIARPLYAVGINPIRKEGWNADDISHARSLLNGQVLVADVQEITVDGLLLVNLYEQQVYASGCRSPSILYKPLIDAGLVVFECPNNDGGIEADPTEKKNSKDDSGCSLNKQRKDSELLKHLNEQCEKDTKDNN